jgi:3D (Asp-Asp-Asp) domain-containing protein
MGVSGSFTLQSALSGSTTVISGSSASTGSFGRVEATTLRGDGSAITGVTAGALNIDNQTDGTSVTVATTDLLIFSDSGTEKKMQMKQMAAPLASVISGSFTAASSSIDTRIEGIADPIAMAIALGG